MQHIEITDIARKKYGKILIAYTHVSGGYHIEDIHTFRVGVKKLRAFLRLTATTMYGEVSRSRLNRLPAYLQRFYETTGRVRNLQVQGERIRAIAGDKPDSVTRRYLKWLEREQEKAQKLIQKLAEKKTHFQKEQGKIMAMLPDRIDEKIVRRFLYLRIMTLEKLIGPFLPDDEAMHLTRKILKDILYTWPYFGDETAILLQPGLFSGRQEVQSIAGRLGEFQDYATGLELLSEKTFTLKEKRSVLEDVALQWQLEKEVIRQEVYKLLRPKILAWQSQ